MDFRVDWESVRPVRTNFRSRFNLLNFIEFFSGNFLGAKIAC